MSNLYISDLHLSHANISMWGNDIPKHQKKKDSSVSMAKTKSNHKHRYVDCVLEDEKIHIKAEYCKICGKIGKRDWFTILKSRRDDIGNLERIKIDNVFECKYINS